ncbi:MAG: hypothetical protein IB618_01310 [Candidatus Pacearchaeota archaeon]|nr:MAG: hypothetical protein IB618_01310 [Candidatus Pacearchaeota archaeon]
MTEEIKEIKKIIEEIQVNYRKKLKTDKEIFYHLLEQIGKHIIKLTKLKEKEDKEGHFKEEVADMYLLSLGLIELEKIDDKKIKKAAKYYLSKVKEVFGDGN